MRIGGKRIAGPSSCLSPVRSCWRTNSCLCSRHGGLLDEHPANVRGLDRRLWQALSASHGDFVVAPPPGEPVPAAAQVIRADALDEASVREALEKSGGNISDAARALGLKNRQVLHRIVKKLERP